MARGVRVGGAFLRSVAVALALGVGMLTGTPALAASLAGPISGWATSSVPSYISMYQYVPAKLATNPPILVVSHYCGGTASGVFGEANGGGIVAAADQYGFVMIFPQTSNNCWDVGSTASLTHNGGGDTQAIAEMVTYAVTKFNADAGRVYAVGTSSGAMMTEALLAVYPDVFKAGAEFSGVPAGCWAASYSASNQWSGPCASGQVTKTAQQWGDQVRAMDPGYAGFRPRIQLWHGTADGTINYNNQTQAIAEWTNVLGLGATPTSTTSVTLNSHQWTRQSWQNSCGFTVLDAWSEQSGPHGTDANLNAMYVIPFLGLDKVGSTDPEVAQCSDGGSSSSSSASSSGSTTGSASSSARTSSGSTSGGGTSTSSAGGSGTGANSSTQSGGSTSGGSGSLVTASSNGGSTGASGAGGTSSDSNGTGASTGVSASGSGVTGGWEKPSSASGCACDLARGSGRSGAAAGAMAVFGVLASMRRRSRRMLLRTRTRSPRRSE